MKHKRNFEKAQRQGEAGEKYDADRMQLNLQRNQSGLLDVEVALNDRPLSYVEDDIQMPLVTPESMVRLSLTCCQNWNHTLKKPYH